VKSILISMVAVMLLAGCGSNAKVMKEFSNEAAIAVKANKLDVRHIGVTAKDVPDHFIAAVKGYLKIELRKKGLLSPEGNANALALDMNVNYYRMRSGFTRAMMGILAGKDGVAANVKILDKKTGKAVTQMEVSSYNISAIGDMDDVARLFAEEVANTIEKHINKK